MATPVGQNQYGDDIYATPNGQRTGTQITQELQAAGWDGQGDPVSVYNRTAADGQNTGSQPTGGSGGSSSGGGTPVPSGGGGSFNSRDFADAIAKGVGPLFQQSAGFSREQLAEQKRQFDAQLQLQRDQLERIGVPQLLINQREQSLREQMFTFQSGIAEREQALAERRFNEVELADQKLRERAQTMAEAGLGLDFLKTAASMGGPENVFQQSAFYRGASQQAGLPRFIGALQNNNAAQLADFNAPGAAPIRASAQGALAKLQGGGNINGLDEQGTLNAIQGIANRGPQGLAPGTLERLDPDELAALGSGFKAVGQDLPSWLRTYQRLQPQQSAATGVALAA